MLTPPYRAEVRRTSERPNAALRMANEITLDARSGRIIIDGLEFPYYVVENPEIEVQPGGVPVGVLHIGILADNITLINGDGSRTPVQMATREAELAWARRRATEIVVAGLADVLTQIKEKQQ